MGSRVTCLVGPALVLSASAVVAATVGCSSSGGSVTDSSSSSSIAAPSTPEEGVRPGETRGALLYRTKCAACHGSRGEGNLGPPLVAITDRLTEAEERTFVRTGRGRMPAFAPGLSDGDIAAVVAYTRTDLQRR